MSFDEVAAAFKTTPIADKQFDDNFLGSVRPSAL